LLDTNDLEEYFKTWKYSILSMLGLRD
jgi:hypothetical protein